ncbi:hypothetical protein Pan216_53850 [Planctomycetes bacterium Pan216]|uniref:Uncharacterized protein n=1 Tax=Kolteria novifilia TaxID=2527975 RepID=A0A518BBY0_9BACT|nr:hypothetical protein Pan216_53850 [Planctomycetes bacterium Pan216]
MDETSVESSSSLVGQPSDEAASPSETDEIRSLTWGYGAVCLVSVALMVLLLQGRYDFGSSAPVSLLILAIVAVTGIVLRTSLAPPVLILILTLILFESMDHPLRIVRLKQGIDLEDVLLVACFVGYLAGHYRYCSLPRESSPSTAAEVPKPKPRWEESPWWTTLRPLGILLAFLPLWPLGAALLWRLIPSERGLAVGLGIPSPLASLLAWVWTLAFLVVACRVGWYVARRDRQPADVSRMFLLETVWREMRRDMNTAARYLGRHRRKRKR